MYVMYLQQFIEAASLRNMTTPEPWKLWVILNLLHTYTYVTYVHILYCMLMRGSKSVYIYIERENILQLNITSYD